MNKEKIDIFKRFESKRVMVLGDLMLDHYIWGKVERISPEAPVPVLDAQSEEYRLGGAANVALNLKALGAKVCLIGVCGDDLNAQLLIQNLEKAKISTEGLIQIPGRCSTLKTRISSRSQQIVRVDHEDSHLVDEDSTDALVHKVYKDLDSCDAVIVADYDKGVLGPRLIQSVIDLASKAGVPVAVDPKYRHFSLYKDLLIFKPNYKEFEAGLGAKFAEVPSFLEAAKAFRKEQNIAYLVITRGAKGMYLFSEEDSLHFEALSKEVYDVSGAGDTVISVLTLAHISGLDMPSSTHYALHAASVVCGKLGTATLSPKELWESLNHDKR